MKITLDKKHREAITTLRAQLAAALAAISHSSAKMEQISRKQEKLQSEIAALENAADADSEAAAGKLATKRVLLENVLKNIEELESVSPQEQGRTNDDNTSLLRQFTNAAVAAVAPDLEAYAGEIATTIRPWCLNDTDARAMAFQLPACKSLCQTYSQRFGDFGGTVPALKAAIARADEILSGELNWKWDAKQ